MSLRIDIECTRCGRRVGTAKVSVALHGSFNAFDSTEPANQRSLLVDQDDLRHWNDRHSTKECDTRINENRAKHDAAMLARERNFELPISVS